MQILPLAYTSIEGIPDISLTEKIVTVRGELSAINCKIEIPIYGDPALLMPLFYNPTFEEKKHEIGIIPHWSDFELYHSLYKDKYKIINPLSPVKEVIKDIVSCEKIASSSLHGLILSDAYGIPSQWLYNKRGMVGSKFKFYDYFSTTDNKKHSFNLIDKGNFYISNYKFNKKEFLKTCPFYE
jgi:pyruvyltransferase